MTQPRLFPEGATNNHDSLEDAYYTTLKNLLDSGNSSASKDEKSVGGGRESLEILNYSQSINNIRRRVMAGDGRRINFPAALARFVWMMSGSDRVSDIAFYEPRVSNFSDDGLSVPGSSYGQRILRPRPGINQLNSVVETLKQDPGSRRAAIAIYQAEDAARQSADIPCTFGLFFGVRNGILHSTTIMRSNNAFILFPYNVFEFSLLAEVVATELNIDLGPLHHYAFSMHIYSENFEGARKCTANKPAKQAFEMPKMPIGSKDWERPLEQIRRLTILESIMRHRVAGIRVNNVDHFIKLDSEEDGNLTFGKRRKHLTLTDYWKQFYYLLIIHSLINNTSHFTQIKTEDGTKYSGSKEGIEIFNRIFSYLWDGYRTLANFPILHDVSTDSPNQIELPSAGDIQVFASHQSPMNSIIKDAISEFEQTSGNVVGWQTLDRLQSEYLDQVAARQSDDLKAAIIRHLENENS